ncbi:hypothetical protein [Streptomyces sp. NBC_01092]|uniref:hypothetical protein n=1 Tax=Streptomyces sp. NBC_01092 TaxID=2903748 RepID=UPI00386C2658|nr:hypothetical protein OG254_24175 [Streptomyces sp. NBC_01092]
MFWSKGTDEPGYQESFDAVGDAYRDYGQACRTYGDHSPQAEQSREVADQMGDEHRKNYPAN